MPHAWWHKDVVDRGWDAFKDYVVPVGQDVLEGAVQLPVVKQTLQGLEAIHQKGVVPAVSAPLQYIPLEWQQDAGVDPAPWYRPDLRFQQGSIQPTFDAYMKPEGGVSPSALLDAFTTFTGPGIARDVMGEWFDFETNPQDTIRAKRIDEVSQQREAETGVPISQRERREIGSDIYKLPPYVRGVAEELPYLAIPPARVARTALQGARAGQALSTAGRLGAAAPLARTGLRGAEMALKPVELLERGAERVITAPFRGIGAVGRGVGSQVGASRARAEARREAIEAPQREIAAVRQAEVSADMGPRRQAEDVLEEYTGPVDREVLPGASVEQQVPVQPTLFGAAVPNINFRTAAYEPFESAKNLNPRAENLAPKSPEEFMNVKARMSDDGQAGYLIDNQGDFGNLFANPAAPEGAGISAVIRAVNEGALTLDAYDGFLPQYYSRAGWVEVARNRFVDEFAPPGWDYERLGRPDIVHMAYTGGDRASIINRYGSFPHKKANDIFNYTEDFDAAKQLAREVAQQADQRLDGANARRVDRPVEAGERRGVVPEEPGTPREPGSVGAVPEPELTTPQSLQSRRESSPSVGHQEAEQAIGGRLSRLKDKLGGDYADRIAAGMKARFPNIADKYVAFITKAWDSSFGLRILEDHAWRSANPNALFNPLARMAVPVADRLVRATGAAVGKGHARYTNFMRDKIEPLLARGATTEAIERYIQAKHWAVLASKFEKRNVPSIVDPADPTKNIPVDSSDLVNWTDREWIRRNTIEGVTLSDDALDAIEQGAREIRDLYSEQRRRMLTEGIIDQERFDYWSNEYQWYNPIQYQEFADQGDITNMYRGLNGGLSHDGIQSLSKRSVESLGALPPLGEVMLKNLIATELRLTRNSITKRAMEMGLGQEIGLTDVSSKFVRKKMRKEEFTDELGQRQTREVEDIELMPVRYEEGAASGFISYYDNGQRYVYGGIDGNTAPKWFWDVLNGRSGLALRGDKEINAILGASNGFFRSVYTTFNPLFFMRNGLIDMFTVFLKAGVLPTTTGARVMKSLWNVARNNEDRMMELVQLSGGYSDRFYDVDGNLRKITEELRTASTRQDATVVNPKDVAGKTLDRHLRNAVNPNTGIGGKLKRVIPTTGSAVEQAPRLAVAEKALKRYIGETEYKRIMKLDRKSFNDEMLNNWKGTGRGLVDSDEMQRAAQNGVEATLDFSRGGDQIRRWNNYILFLNAAMEGMKLPFRTLGINLHPVVRPVRNPVEGGPSFEFGSASEQLKNALPWQGRGVTGKVFDGVNGGPRNAAVIIGSAVATYWGIQNYWNKQFTYEGKPLYYDIPSYIRYNSLIFMLPPDKDENGELILDPNTNRPVPKYLVIPHRLREWNLLFQQATLLDELTDEEVPVDKSKWAIEVFKSTSPVSDVPMPELLNAGMEEITGYDFFRQAPIVDEELQGQPLKEQYNQWTSETARKAAGILDNVPAPDLIGDVIGSPQRLDHLYENFTGGIGKLASSFSDYAFRLADELRGVEQRPMAEKVEEYREMDRTSRREFMASLNEEEYEEFNREIRMPKKETPFWDAMIKSFYPEKGGGLFEVSQTQTEEAFPEVSAEDTRKEGRLMGKVRQQLKFQQDKDDQQLQSWVRQGTGAKLSPKEWRDEKSDRWNKYEGAEIASTQIYQQSIRGQSDEVREAYYDSLYTAAGKMGDIRVGADLLLAGYYAIEPSDSTEDGVNNTDWTDFFAQRERYIESIRLSSEAAGDNMYQEVITRLQANMTPTEKAYDNSRKLLAPYWNAGRNVQELFPNASPQFQQVWDSYLNADSGRRNALYNSNPIVKTLVERRSQLRKQILLRDAQQNGYPNMELALVFWYGDFYDQPLTPQAKAYYNNLYGRSNNISGFVPTAPVQGPVQGPQLPVGAR